MLHESLSSLIALVRRLVGDAILPSNPAHASSCDAVSGLSDGQIQRALEATREMIRYERLEPIPTILPGGAVEYRIWRACDGHLGNGFALLDNNYHSLAFAEFSSMGDYLSGEIVHSDVILGEFATHSSFPNGLMLVGSRYDPFCAAADLLTMLASAAKRDVDFSEQGLSIKQSQAADRMMALAREYRKQQRIRSIEFGRSDIGYDRSRERM